MKSTLAVCLFALLAATALPAADADIFTVPKDADAKGLCAFCVKLFRMQQEFARDPAKAAGFQKQMTGPLMEACKLILEKDSSDRSGYAHFARHCLLNAGASAFLFPESADGKLVTAEMEKLMKSPRFQAGDVNLCMRAIHALQMSAPEKARPLYPLLAKAVEDLQDPWLEEAQASIAGSIRQLDIVGKPLDIKGTTVDGKPFDLASLRGKIVLVDFWATWCVPCREELPNVVLNYTAYHAKGFEVVGISGDQDREMLVKFLAQEPLPWPTLHEKGGRHPAMEAYGVASFPTTFLVGKDGKVLAMNARGPRLGELLKAELGDPEKVEKKEAPKPN